MAFRDIVMIPDEFWKNARLKFGPELPMASVKRNKVTYSFTDLRYLNEGAIEVVVKIISAIAYGRVHTSRFTGAKVVWCDLSGMCEDRKRIICEIVTSLKYKAKWRKGSADGCLLIDGCEQTDKFVGFHIIEHDIAPIQKLFAESEDNLSFVDVVVAVVDDSRAKLERFMEERDDEAGNQRHAAGA